MVFVEKPQLRREKYIGVIQTTDSQDGELEDILQFLVTLKTPESATVREAKALITKSNKYFVTLSGTYRRKDNAPPRKVVFNDQNRQRIMEEFHEKAGH